MATQNVVVQRTGTNWTIDVTNVNLLADLTIKDFVVKENGVVTCNALSCPNYAKTNRTTLTYTGAAVATNTTIEVQRKTPNTTYRTYSHLERILPGDLNAELDRAVRWREEADLNGVGTASLVQIALPKDDAYGVIWNNDNIYPPTRNAVYDKIETLAPLDGANLTNASATTQATTDADNSLATTAYVKNNLASYGNLPYVPVQRGGGAGQSTNALYLGWDGAGVKVQVDSTDLGRIALLSNIALVTGGFKIQNTQFLSQSTVVTTNSTGDFAITFPTAFGSGVTPTVVAFDGDGTGTPKVIVGNYTSTNNTGFAGKVVLATTGAAVASGAVRINWSATGTA